MKTVIFDIGNVLIFFSHQRMFIQIAEVCGLSPELVKKELVENGLGIRYEGGEITTEEVYAHFESLAPKKFKRKALKQAMANIFSPNESLYPIVKDLKSKGIRLVLLSNISEIHFAYIKKKFAIIHDFDEAVLSYEVKALKPNPHIFKSALEAAKTPPNDCFYIDDIFEHIQAARTLGIDAEQYIDTPKFLSQLAKRKLLD